MITMVDEIYDRGFQAGRAELNQGISALAAKLRKAVAPALSAIHHFEWDAPWSVQPGTKAKV
jgi:hypothetical protein